MRNSIALISAGILFGSCCVALADEVTAPAAVAPTNTPTITVTAAKPAATPVADSANTVVCRKQAAPAGSLIGGSQLCLTQHEWDARHIRAEEQIERQQHTYGGTTGLAMGR